MNPNCCFAGRSAPRRAHPPPLSYPVAVVQTYVEGTIELAPGRYRVFGFPPMTGLLLDRWIEVHAHNPPGRYGDADLPIHTAMPHLLRIEDAHGKVVWP